MINAVNFPYKAIGKKKPEKKIRASIGFEPVTSAIPMRCSTNELWSHTLGARSISWVHIYPWQRSKLTFSKNRLLATFNLKLVAIKRNSVAKKTLGSGGHFMTYNNEGLRRWTNIFNTSLCFSKRKRKKRLSQTFQPSRFDRETHGLGCQLTVSRFCLSISRWIRKP